MSGKLTTGGQESGQGKFISPMLRVASARYIRCSQSSHTDHGITDAIFTQPAGHLERPVGHRGAGHERFDDRPFLPVGKRAGGTKLAGKPVRSSKRSHAISGVVAAIHYTKHGEPNGVMTTVLGTPMMEADEVNQVTLG